MLRLKLIDFDVLLPPDVELITEPPNECVIDHQLDGASVAKIREDIEKAAVEHGYTLHDADARGSRLQRGERIIRICASSPSRVFVSVDDVEALPFSQVTPKGIRLGSLALPVTGAARIEPGRERHDQDSRNWVAEWRIYGKKASELATEIHDALLRRPLSSGGIWPPPRGGIPRWHVEASSPKELVQVGITEEGESLAVHITLITDDTGPPR